MSRLTWALLLVLGGGIAFQAAQQPGLSPEAKAERDFQIRGYVSCERAIKEGLKDPDSARFPDQALAVKKQDGTVTVAMANIRAKNSFGGYTVSNFICSGRLNDGGRVIVESVKETR